MVPDRFRYSCRQIPALAIFIMPTPNGTHCGIVHRDGLSLRLLDLLWHGRLRTVNCREGEDYACVVPDLQPEEINDIAGICRLVESRNAKGDFAVPYAFRFDGAVKFSQTTGDLMLEDGVGLTCSTFVLAVFESARVSLVDLSGWPARAEDAEVQDRLLVMMRDGIPGFAPPAALEHIQKVRAELPCIRVRPEEVAGAALAEKLPASFEQADLGGRMILQWLTNPKQ